MAPALKAAGSTFWDLTLSYFSVSQWHLGFFKTEYTPTKRGFDSFFGYWCGKEDYWDHSNREIDGWGLDLHNDTKVNKH